MSFTERSPERVAAINELADYIISKGLTRAEWERKKLLIHVALAEVLKDCQSTPVLREGRVL